MYFAMQSNSRCKPSRWAPIGCLLLGLLRAASAHAGGGPFGIDHEWGLDKSGIWAQKDQNVLEYAALATELGGGIWFGRDSELGRTFWQSVDSTAIASVSAEILKLAFSRARPDQGGNPNKWFQGSCCDSFPSGEVTLQASFVTPLIANYARSDPWIWTLEALPLYTGIARLKNQVHWQSDVIAGWALGSAVGYWSTRREIPISVQLLPRGLTFGVYYRY
jgi:hypothetical protein